MIKSKKPIIPKEIEEPLILAGIDEKRASEILVDSPIGKNDYVSLAIFGKILILYIYIYIN